jgi:hypothetical protein
MAPTQAPILLIAAPERMRNLGVDAICKRSQRLVTLSRRRS